MALWHPSIPDGVHGCKLRGDIRQPDLRGQDPGLVGARLSQQRVDLGEDRRGLFSHRSPRRADLPRQIGDAVMGDELAHAGVGVVAGYIGHGKGFHGLLLQKSFYPAFDKV